MHAHLLDGALDEVGAVARVAGRLDGAPHLEVGEQGSRGAGKREGASQY